jgi:hypothetical protein
MPSLNIQCIILQKTEEIIDLIDIHLTEALKLSSEELDYIINYDIKYHMGLNGEEAEDDE